MHTRRRSTRQSGYARRLDTAARMNMLDGVRHLNQSLMEEVGHQFGANGVEIDAHMLCAEDHLPYQGGQYSNDEFERIQDSLPRPFGEWNCRHTWHGIILGVSPPAYTPEQLAEMRRFSTETITIDGRTKTRYQWSQEMRRCEVAIRQKKDLATLAKASGDESLRRKCQSAIVELNKYYGELAGKAGVKAEYQRTFVQGFRDAKQELLKMGKPIDQGQWPNGGPKISPDELKKLTDYAAEKGVKLVSFNNFDGDVSIVRDFLNGMAHVGKDYPDVFSGLRQPELALSFRMSPADYAETGQHRITLNAHILRNKQFLNSDYVNAVDPDTGEKLFVQGATYMGIIYHEMGHMISLTYALPENRIVKGIKTGNISCYAKKNSTEAIAEAFNDYYSGIKSPESLKIIERCGTIIIERRESHDDKRS